MKLFSKGRGRKPNGFEELEEKVEAMPDSLYQLSEDELDVYGEYLNHLLNDNEKRTLRHYCHGETIGNKIQSYAKAYDIDINHPDQDTAKKNYKRVSSHVYDFFATEVAQHYIETLYAKADISEASVVNRLKYLIDQAEDKKLSLDAIKHYDSRKGRIKSQLEITGGMKNTTTHNFDTDNLTKEELTSLITILSKTQPE